MIKIFLLSLSLVCCSATPAVPSVPRYSWHERQRAVEALAEAGDTTECLGRRLAYEFGLKLQPHRHPMLEVFDALFSDGRGGYTCNMTRPSSNPRNEAHRASRVWGLGGVADGATFYVDATKGDDSSSGAESAPFRTVARAVAAARALGPPSADAPRTVLLRAGIHYLAAPLDLGPADSFLTLSNYDGEEAWLSGGVPIKTAWSPYRPPDPLQNASCSTKCKAEGHCCEENISSFGHPSCAMACLFKDHKHASTEAKCRELCAAADSAGCKFQVQNESFDMCQSCPTGCSAADGVEECYTGCRLAFGDSSIWKTPLAADGEIYPFTSETVGEDLFASVTGLFSVSPHARFTRARYPNAEPENRDTVRTIPKLHYIAPRIVPAAQQRFINLTDTIGLDSSTLWQYNVYANGVCDTTNDPNCPCGTWTDQHLNGTKFSQSYWCSNATAGGWSEEDQGDSVFNGPALPVGLQYNSSDPAFSTFSRYRNATGAIVTTWRDQGWFCNMWQVSSHNPDKGELRWNKGGWQGGRGYRINSTKGVPHEHTLDCNGDFFIENVFEELDSPGEFFYNESSNVLYLFANASNDDDGTSTLAAAAKPSPTEQLIVPRLKELVGIRGTSAAPAKNITIRGIGFRDQAFTYMDPWMVPSGGDWAIHHGGAIFLEGAEGVRIDGNRFVRLDGNALFVSGYQRGLVINDNEFSWLGESAMASWGYTEPDTGSGLSGEQPRGTTVSGNYAHEVGVWELQSSMWFQAKTAQTNLHSNVFFNGPRAGINFNDGFGGANDVKENLIFNQCRHSGDHGPINSWDRQLFLTDVKSGDTKRPSWVPAPTSIRNNFVIANYGGSQAVDNDDGSSFYDIHDNFFFNSEGLKQDFGGHDSLFHDNVVYVVPVDGQNCINTWPFNDGHQHKVFGNKCIVSFENKVSTIGGLDCKHPNNSVPIIDDLHDNEYYTPDGNASASCGDTGFITIAEMQAGGSLVERGSKMLKLPSDEEIFSWARAKLLMD